MLKKQILSFAASALLLAGATLSLGHAVQAQATTYFNFNNDQSVGGSADFSITHTTTGSKGGGGFGPGTITSNFDNNTKNGTGNAGKNAVFYTTGTTINGIAGETAGNALQLNTGTPTNQSEIGNYFTIETSSTGLTNLKFSYATLTSGTGGFTTQTLSYSTDGNSFTDFGVGSLATPTTTYQKNTFDLSSIATLNNKSNIFLRITLSGGTASSTNFNAFDNIQVTPAPPGLTSLLLGLSAIGLRTWRRRKADAAVLDEAV